MPPRLCHLFTLVFFLMPPPGGMAAAGPIDADIVIRGGTLVDGTGAPGRRADLAIRGDRIVAVGEFEARGGRIIDASGKVVAPGFIDLHTHSDEPILTEKGRANRNYVIQGVTTIVTGNCGSGPVDVRAFLGQIARQGAGSNVIHLIPHGTLRRAVLGNADKEADPAALGKMRNLVGRGMEAGAWGISTGLIYVPSRYGGAAELIDLCKVVAEHGGIYATHMRDEGEHLLESIDEAIAIGEGSGARVQISHLKSSGKANWGRAGAALAKIAGARARGASVYADQYPYVASSTRLGAMVVPDWARQGDEEEFARIAADPDRGPKLREAIAAALEKRDGGRSVRIARFAPKPEWVGLDLDAIAKREGRPALEIILEIEKLGDAQAISFGMSEEDVAEIMKSEFVATSSDGGSHVPGGGDRPHPRSYGTFPRKIRYALEDKVMSLEQAIRAGTGLPAEILGLPERGTIRAGAYADLIVFDPATFRDAATFEEPTRYPSGMEHVFVNGVAVVSGGEFCDKLPGRALRLGADGPAERVVRVGRVWTGDPGRPWAEAIAIRDGVIAAVGSREEIGRWVGPKTEVVDHPEGFAIPGLIDAHAHIASYGESLEQLDLRGDDLERIAAKVAERAKALPDGAWVRGNNWDQSLWPGGEFPTAEILDRASPDRPVWLTRVDGHAGWANTAAMKLAGVTRESKIPSDGEMHRNASGDPTGVFIDGAMGLVASAIPATPVEELKRQILKAQGGILAAGLTGVHDASLSRREIEAFRALDASGELKLRVYGMASPPEGREAEYASEPPQPEQSGGRFELRAIKLFADGALGSRGAWLFAPYADDPDNDGLALCPPERIEAATAAALKSGWQVCVHAIGDRANAEVLSAFESALKAVPGARDPRLRIEHAQVIRREDVPRFARSGIIASMQPQHAGTDKRWAEARLGPERAKGAYAWRWFLDEKVRMAYGSDFPVEVVSPFWGLYVAVTRQDEAGEPSGGWHPEHRLTLEEALDGYTRGAAYAAFWEGRLGALKPGMRADITIVDRDLFSVAPKEILGAKVLATVIDGETVYPAK